MESYKNFARVYDEFMDQTPYDTWFCNIRELFVRFQVPQDGSVLDLGCGTGKMARRLSRAGYQVTAADRSEQMLEIAASVSDDPVLYVQQDMVSLELPGKMDAVISICDCMNYIIEPEDFEEVLTRVKNSLKDGGIFVFDMNTRFKYEKILSCNTFAEDREDASFIWNNFYDEQDRINEYQLSLFIQNEQGTYDKYEELHIQKAYDQEEVCQMILKAGFTKVEVLDVDTMKEPEEETERLYFIAQICAQ